MVSCSFKKPHKRIISLDSKKPHNTKISLDSLPDDLLVVISSRIASTSLAAYTDLRLVSKPFRRFCDDEKYILSRVPLCKLPLFPWSGDERFSNIFKICRMNGNPEALYRNGLINFFLKNKKLKGLGFLSKAVEKGNREAIYVYGMIIICLGGRGSALLGDNTKQKGFKILSALIKPLMSKTMEEMVELRYRIRDKVWWRGVPVMEELKRAYVKEKCECDGRTRKFLATNCVWHRYGEANDMDTSSACEICLWHYEVEYFFYNIQ